MTDREAMELALEALNQATGMCAERTSTRRDIDEAMAALRQALEKHILSDSIRPKGKSITKVWGDEVNQALEQPEPAAWKHDCSALLTNDVELWIDRCPHCGKPRTAPPRREWIWLTDEEIVVRGGMDGADNWVFEFANALQIKLREKNCG